MHVDVRDGKILRIVPLELDDTDGPSWTIHARGRDFTPPRRTTLAPYIVANRSHVYSPKRILTPLKRVDFDVTGAPGSTGPGGRNIQNRGISGYEPITWDEALETVAGEIVKNHRELGPAAMLTSPGSHHLWGILGYRTSAYYRFMNLVGFTYGEHNPDSWEGWHWVGMHMWGFAYRLGIPEQYDLLEDALENAELIVFWSADPESQAGASTPPSRARRAASGSRSWASRWSSSTPTTTTPPASSPTSGWLPGWAPTSPWVCAIAYTWLTEGTYDKEYVDEAHASASTSGRPTSLGESDGQPKDPQWAEQECGIAACEIRALAREWGKKKTMLAAGGRGRVRRRLSRGHAAANGPAP